MRGSTNREDICLAKGGILVISMGVSRPISLNGGQTTTAYDWTTIAGRFMICVWTVFRPTSS